jgi:hypothetical protein
MSPKGSHATWGGWEPRRCIACRRRVTLTESAYHGGALDRPWSIHADCGGIRKALELRELELELERQHR